MDVATQTNVSKTTIAKAQALAAPGINRTWLALTAATGIVVALVFVACFVLAFNWRAQPFPGFKVTHNLVVDGAQPLGGVEWPGLQQGLRRLDRIVGINGERLFTRIRDYSAARANFHAVMSTLKVGDVLTVEFNRPDSTMSCPENSAAGTIGQCSISLTLIPYPDVELLGNYLAPTITGLVTLVIGAAVLILRRNQQAALLISATCFALSAFMAMLFDLNTTHSLIPVWIVATTMLSGIVFALGLTFPVRSILLYRDPRTIYIPFAVSAIAAAVLIYMFAEPPSPDLPLGTLTFAVVLPGLAGLVASLLINRRHAAAPSVRDQCNTVLIGLILTGAPIFVWLLNIVSQAIDGTAFLPFNTSSGTPFALLAPLSMAYAVLQYRLFDTDKVISQGITYAIMLAGLVAGYFLLVLSTSLLITVNLNNPLLIAVTIFVIAAAFLPVRTFLQTRIDKLYYRARHNFNDRLEVFGHDVTLLNKFNDVVDEFRIQLAETIDPLSMFVFLPNRQVNAYAATEGTEIHFGRDTSIINTLHDNDQMIYLDPNRPWPIGLRAEHARMSILKALVILGLPGSKGMNGFVVVGPPRSGRGVYTYEELLFMQSLTTQMATAAERTQVVESLERRVQELDVLGQISQAVNFTIDFDDLLELISTQTSKLIDARYFYIVLLDEMTRQLYFAFFLEDDERYREQENKRWPMGRDLFSEVMQNELPLRVSSYNTAMQQRNSPVQFVSTDLKAWIGVPLIAGPRKLGVMAVGTAESGKSYGDDQFKFFNDISALAATSIDKARLFAETNRRARQLSALNDISQQLAGELDLQRLLELITSSAVDILNSEAGSLLLMVDPTAKERELEFKIAVGSSGQNLIGKRFPIKRGLAGEVATKGKPLIVNDASRDPRWGGEFSKGDFQTNAILAVPLIAKNQTIGVLEVINKRDNGVFVEEDANLLTTFAGQAAIAIENARLFQMTDLQLSARVDELQTLERIDVELNRSLDIHKVAEITMRWAIANSGATAGALGLVVGEPPHLQIVAKYGYEANEYPEGAEENIWPLDRGIVSRVMRTRQPDISADVRIDPSYIPSLRGSLSQITVPMISGGEIKALLILESNKEPRLNLVDLSFVQRLAEHASIALTNAQLLAELTRANESKSEFVGFVAHELKTPMTSIKGYADVLLGGMAGNLNEKQSGFLGVIRSNVDRMNTLVTDLNDVEKLRQHKLHMELSPIDFRNVITETLRPLQKQIEDKRQVLHINMPADMPTIMADQNRLIQVLTNLLSNAHKYTPPEGDIIINGEVTRNRFDPKGKRINEMVMHVTVRDTGIGMSEVDMAKLFTPYFRSDNPLAKEQPGTGLGLIIVKGIVEQHGGYIWVESELGQGTTFHFTVPISTETVPQPTK